MDENQILALTMEQFGNIEPVMDDNCLKLIASFSDNESDRSPEGDLWTEYMRLAGKGKVITPEIKTELETAFVKCMEDETARLSVTTVADVIEGWNRNKKSYIECEDRPWRFILKDVMEWFLERLTVLEFPECKIDELRHSAEIVAKGIPITRDTSHDSGP